MNDGYLKALCILRGPCRFEWGKDDYVQSTENDCQFQAGTNVETSWRELELSYNISFRLAGVSVFKIAFPLDTNEIHYHC
jgi:hypothetical protein